MSRAIVAEVRLLPRVIDFSVITDAAGVGAVAFTMVGAVLRYDRDRLARLTLLGTVLCAGRSATRTVNSGRHPAATGALT